MPVVQLLQVLNVADKDKWLCLEVGMSFQQWRKSCIIATPDYVGFYVFTLCTRPIRPMFLLANDRVQQEQSEYG